MTTSKDRPTLGGKMVFVTQSSDTAHFLRYPFQEYSDLLSEQAPDGKLTETDYENRTGIIFSQTAFSNKHGLTASEAGEVLEEINQRTPKPDVVVIYHPRMDAYGIGPTLKLANALKEMGVPVLIVDENNLSQVNQLAIRSSAAELLPFDAIYRGGFAEKVVELANGQGQKRGGR